MTMADETASARVFGLPASAYTWLAGAVAVAFLAFHLFVLILYPLPPLLFRAWHVAGIVTFAGLIWLAARPAAASAAGLVAMVAAALSATIYLTLQIDSLEMRAGVLPRTADIVFAVLAVIAVLEITRRAAGAALVFLALVFVAYAFLGPYLPGPLHHPGYSFKRLVTFLYTTNGIYGIPVGSSATFIYFFVVFGALLSLSGGADYMMKLALALAGRTKGGTAKVGVVASGLFGMINGTSAGNVVATGSITIPMMINSGFRREFAGATEAVASSGGQILPPVMGAAAFLMIEMTGLSYNSIILSAAVPAILYFFAVFAMVHFEAVAHEVQGAKGVEIPPRSELLRRSYFLLPLIVLLGSLLVLHTSIIRAALYSLLASVLVSLIERATAIGPRRAVEAAIEGARGMIPIAATCATAGIVIGVLNLTGLGIKVAALIVSLTGGILWLTLIVTMIVTIILGMGMPTVAAYAITGAVVAPALVRLGVEPMAAHLFILFFASMSAITPPVALASYAAAAIARADLNRLSLLALKLGLAGFIIPYVFVYHPGLLMLGPTQDIVTTIVATTIAVWALAASLQYPARNRFIRFIWGGGAICIIWPSLLATAVGILAIAVASVWQWGAAWRMGRRVLAE